MDALVKECRKYRIAITGGETSIQNNLKSMDISLTVSGFIKKRNSNSTRV
jgi:hydrogenase maturation factor